MYLVLKVGQHYIHQCLESYLGSPPPVNPGLRIVNTIRPRISNLLPVVIRLVCDFQRNLFVYGLGQFSDCELQCSHVISCPKLDFFAICLHQLEGSPNCIIHEHHRNRCLFIHEAFIGSVFESPIKNCNGVVCSTSSREFFPADYSWVS